MAIEDYIPDFFGGGMPQYLPGLLGEQEAAALQKRANVQGLLGAALSLAQGMSSVGPRRSAAQNILGALAGGFQAGQGAYQGATQNIMMQQEIAKNLLERQKAQMTIEGLKAFQEKYPQFAPIAALNPTEAAKAAAESLAMQPIIDAQMQAFGGNQPMQATIQPKASVAQQPVTYGAPALQTPEGVTTGAIPMDGIQVQEGLPPQDQTLPEVAVLGKKTNEAISNLMNTREKLIAFNNQLRSVPSPRAQDVIKNNNEQLKAIDDQISRLTTADYDFTQLYQMLPREYHGRVNALENAAYSGGLTADQLSQRVDTIFKDAELNTDLIRNYRFAQNDPVNPFKGSFADFKKIGAPQTTVNVADKTYMTERVKQAVKSEEAAFAAINAASDVRAIVDVLKPYRGGALQDFAGVVGAYLPGTSAEQLATSRQVAEAIRSRLAPTLRVENSGPTSDFEMRSFLAAIPSLFNTAEGRELMAIYAQKAADRASAAADIKSQMLTNGTFSINRYKEELKRAGLDTVFTKEELSIIERYKSGKPPAPAKSLPLSPEGKRVYDMYRPR